MVLVLVIGPYTKAADAAASVYAFPWMGPKSTTSVTTWDPSLKMV